MRILRYARISDEVTGFQGRWLWEFLNQIFLALEASGFAWIRSAFMFVHYIIWATTESVKKRVKRASGLLESIVFGTWLEPFIRCRFMALNLGINLSGEKPEGCCFIWLGLYWVGGIKLWSFDWSLFMGREGMVDAWRCKQTVYQKGRMLLGLPVSH